MNLEDQVCSVELAKQLMKLGVKQESAFSWYVFGDHEPELFRGYGGKTDESEMWCAFTAAELGEILPIHVASYRDIHYEEDYELWFCIQYVEGDHSKYRHVVTAETETGARAKMLIYLLKNKITVPAAC